MTLAIPPDQVKRTKYGYYRVAQLPTQEELRDYYARKYYQEAHGSFEVEYSERERAYLYNNLRRLHYCCEKVLGGSVQGRTFLDVGCGEGWAMSFFREAGCEVRGVDYSAFGLEKFNPGVLDAFVQADVFEFLDTEAASTQRYDLIALANVIEHVLDPEDLLGRLHDLLAPGGVAFITFPNDFSPVQARLVELGKVRGDEWVHPPDHLSYFNADSFRRVAAATELDVCLMLADFPVEVFLMNDHANYYADPVRGKQAHFVRTEIMNLLAGLDLEATTEAFLHLGTAGFGRDLTAFVQAR